MDAAGYEESFQEAQEAYRVAVEADVERLDKAADQALRQDDVSAEARTPPVAMLWAGWERVPPQQLLGRHLQGVQALLVPDRNTGCQGAREEGGQQEKTEVQASLLCFLVWRVGRARRHMQRCREISGA